jgi:cytoskeletal protein CcmA (bactofilin family)
MANHQSFIGKGLILKGEITGSGSLLMDGVLEGSIDLRGDRVTLGRHSQVAASVTADEVVVRGQVRGDLHAADRATVCADGSLIGDVTTARILIEDGAFFKGRVEARLHETKPSAPVASQRNAPAA